MPLLLRLTDAYLCPGQDDESGVHITDSSVVCGCGGRNLVSLARVLNRLDTEPGGHHDFHHLADWLGPTTELIHKILDTNISPVVKLKVRQ